LARAREESQLLLNIDPLTADLNDTVERGRLPRN
jgi:hypothetical protein